MNFQRSKAIVVFVLATLFSFAEENDSSLERVLDRFGELNKTSFPEGLKFIQKESEDLTRYSFEKRLVLLVSLADQYIGMGQQASAREVLEKASNLGSGDGEDFDLRFVSILKTRIQGDLAYLDADLSKSTENYQLVQQYFAEQGKVEDEAELLLMLGDNYYSTGQYDLGDECFRKAANLYQSINDVSGFADALVSAGSTGMVTELEQVMGETLNALDLFKQEENLIGQAKVYQNMGYDYYTELNSATDAFQQAISLCRVTGDILTHLSALAGLAEIYAYENYLDEAKETIDLGLELLKTVDDPHVSAHVNRVAGVVYMFGKSKDSHDLAHRYYDSALEFYRKLNDVELEMATVIGFAELLMYEERYDEALQMLEPTVEWHKEHLPDLLGDVFNLKREIQVASGDFEGALETEIRFREHQEEEWSSGLREKYEALDKSYQEELRKNEIRILEQENALQQLELNQQKEAIFHFETMQAKTRVIWVIALLLIVSAFVLLGALYFLYRARGDAVEKTKQLNQLLEKEKLDEIEKAKQLRVHNLELMSSNLQLKAVNEERKELLAFAAHDLKNPLGAVCTSLDLLEQGISKEEDREENLEILEVCKNGVNYMGDLVRKILESKVAERHAQNLELVSLDPLPELNQMIDINRPAADQKDILIETNYESGVEIVADAHALREVMDNLISNAIKYCPIGGRVSILTEHLSDGIIIRVQDSGEGVPTSEHELLFKPFSKVSTMPTNGESSNGLGLSIAKQLVDSIGGEISFRNLSEGGAEFSVKLPIAEKVVPREVSLVE